MATDPDYDRKKSDKPKRLYAYDGVLEVDYQRGHIQVPDGGPDIPAELIIAVEDKGWAEIRIDGRDMTEVGRELGLALLREFDPASLAPLPIHGSVTEEKLEQEIDEMGERPTQSHARLIIGQVLDFAAGDPYVEGRLITRLQKKLGTTGPQIKKEVEFVQSERNVEPPVEEPEAPRRRVEMEDDDRSPRDDRDDDDRDRVGD